MGALSILLSRIAPLKDWLFLAGFIGVIGFFLYAAHHERMIGQQKFADQLALKEAIWQRKVTETQQHADLTIGQLNGRLAAGLLAPPANPTHVRVCNGPSVGPGTVPPVAGPGRPGDASGRPDSGVADTGTGGDIGPDTEVLLNRLDAKLKYLQGYILACQTAGMCAKE